MTVYSRNAEAVSSARPGVSRLALAAVLGIAYSACVQSVGAQPVTAGLVIQGEALRRANAMLALNLALSQENLAPTKFQNVVSLDDADVVARAQALSAQAGHNGLHYDYFRFKALLDKARTVKADKVDIPAATYRIYAPQNLPSGAGLVEASALSHVVIDGHGATILFASVGTAAAPLNKTSPRGGIHMSCSDHVVLRDLVLDWYEPIAVPVRVNGTGQPGSPQTLTVDRAFPIDPALPIPIRGVLPYDVAQRKFVISRDLSVSDFGVWSKEHSPSGAMTYLCPPAISGVPASTCFRYIGNQTYAFGPTERLSPLPSNPANFLAGVRDNNFAAIVVDGGSSFMTVSGVAIYSSPGAGLMIINAGKAIHVSRVRIVRKPDALLRPGEQKRFISTLADGMNVVNSAGSVVIEDSEIANQADDGLNIRAAMARADVVDAHTVHVKAGAVANFYRIGGLVDVYDDKGINLVASNVAITAVALPAAGGEKYTVALSGAMPSLHPGSAYQVRILDWGNDNVVVRSTWFHDSTERGVVVHDADTAIINNRFDRTGESAVQAVYDNQTGTAEGAIASNLVIAGNRIHDVNVSWFDPALRSIAAPGAIALYFGARSGFSNNTNDSIGNVVARHLVVSDNSIDSVPGVGILVSQADDVIIARNQITHSAQHAFGVPLIDGHAIVVERTTHLMAANNTTNATVVMSPH